MSNGKKLLIAAVCAAILAACQAEDEKKEDIAINTGLILQEAIKQEEKEIFPTQSGYIGDSSWENEKPLLVHYKDAVAPQEYQNEFYVETVGEEVVYRFTNKGESPFEWRILTPDQRIWNNGHLSPGQSKTFAAVYQEGYMPKGLYTFSIISSPGQESLFDFVFSAPE